MSNGIAEEIDLTWTPREYFNSWKKMPEDKGSAPGWSFAHIKSICPTSQAAEAISQLSLLPLLMGYVPEEWKKGVDSMIPIKAYDLRPEKLRLILLMDCRFNHNNKLIGKKMMEFGEKKGLLA